MQSLIYTKHRNFDAFILKHMTSKLFIVSTPIGNLGDITLRAIETLKEVDFVLCEDTRVSKKLLDFYNIDTPTRSLHHHSSERELRENYELLEQGKNLALVSDAGTPGISDPGNLFIDFILKRGSEVEIIPINGVSAVTAILSVSGFATDKFVFLGFIPQKKKRQAFLEEINDSKYTTVFFESNHRIEKCIAEMGEILDGDRRVCIGRELTKKFETVYRGSMSEILDTQISAKGEFVIVVEGRK